LTEIGARKAYTAVAEDDTVARRFADSRGFRPTGHSHQKSRLAVDEADLAGCEELAARLRSEGVRITTLAAEGGYANDSLVRALYELDRQSGQSAPGSEPFQMVPYEVYLWELVEHPSASADRVWIALESERPVGTAVLEKLSSDAMANDWTGVLPSHRGRGIARVLKARSIEWCRRQGIRYVYTENDETNSRIIDINVRLGYRPIPGKIELAKSAPFAF
jgi:GNAT superfamily N-acetyltransferase